MLFRTLLGLENDRSLLLQAQKGTCLFPHVTTELSGRLDTISRSFSVGKSISGKWDGAISFRNSRHGNEGGVELIHYILKHPNATILQWKNDPNYGIDYWLKLAHLWDPSLRPFHNQVINLKDILGNLHPKICECSKKFNEVFRHNNFFRGDMIEGHKEPYLSIELAEKSSIAKCKSLFDLQELIIQRRERLPNSCLTHSRSA
jgi:hypothetical protein